jgi:hypothetical protein
LQLTKVEKKNRTGAAMKIGKFRFSFDFLFFNSVFVELMKRMEAIPGNGT